jgi:heme/copper-type cytochrome/quinol oxidase subunit 2
VPVYISREGIFYGQCSELCGISHGFMPISIQVISYKDYLNYFLTMSLKEIVAVKETAVSDKASVTKKVLLGPGLLITGMKAYEDHLLGVAQGAGCLG